MVIIFILFVVAAPIGIVNSVELSKGPETQDTFDTPAAKIPSGQLKGNAL